MHGWAVKVATPPVGALGPVPMFWAARAETPEEALRIVSARTSPRPGEDFEVRGLISEASMVTLGIAVGDAQPL